ncbi:MAG: hypothetical protein JZU47_10930 [Prolixibacteraceae bacterium]|nr:hypothetical protein [Prolixibacteraceae bacterium]
MENKLLGTDRPVAIYYALQSDIASIYQSSANTVSLEFKPGKDFKLINTTIGTIDLQEDSQKTDAQIIYSNDLKAVSPGHEENTPDHISSLSGRKLILRIDYRSGMRKIIGTLDEAPRLLIKIISATSTTRKIESSFNSPEPNYWLD